MIWVNENGNQVDNVEVDLLKAPVVNAAPDGPVDDTLAEGITPRFVNTVVSDKPDLLVSDPPKQANTLSDKKIDLLATPDPPKFSGNPKLNEDSFDNSHTIVSATSLVVPILFIGFT